MSAVEVEACVAILEDHFGPLVSYVGKVLLGEAAVLSILYQRVRGTLDFVELKRALIILAQHGILRFAQDERQRVIYSTQTIDVLRLLRAARCSFVAKTLYGEIAETICEELVSQGRLTCSSCIRRVAARLEVDIVQVKNIFARLAETQFVMRCPKVESKFCGCPVFVQHVDPFMVPDAILEAGKKERVSFLQKHFTCILFPDSQSRKRKHSEDPDADIYWCVNFLRFERYLRDEMVVMAYKSGDACHENCIKVLQLLLKVAELKADSSAASSSPISIHDVVRTSSANNMGLEKHDIKTALQLLCESSCIVRKVGESCGGLFVIDFEKAITLHCQRHIESAIREKLDLRAVRVFRLLTQKGFLEEDHIEKLAMLSTKEARELCYNLLEKEFVLMKHVAKTNDFAPARTIYLYYVDLSVVAHNLYVSTCKISEVEEMYLTPSDRATLEKYRKGQLALMSAEIELDHDLLLYSLFLKFARRKL
ncbi:unnamed protein product [Gongylonema pulchrum]|uniref:DNA-directed RNA polymerase III subunit RPC3 n=1 Tax=Gongylonema pulchrum TaxID=637853 RepID=A0A183CX52_9BILA|nr:unnamed protein product [Gongylonema pulchrum]